MTHMTPRSPKLLEEAEKHGKSVKAYGDGAYDSTDIYELLDSNRVEGHKAAQEQPITHHQKREGEM